jgi:dienelactone hydrolase family protein
MDFEPNHSQVTKRHVGLKVVLLLILAASATAFAQNWARAQLEKSPPHREWVTVNYNGRSIETFVVYPEAKEKRPVVLIIHEIFGLTDGAQELADEVGAAGYMAARSDAWERWKHLLGQTQSQGNWWHGRAPAEAQPRVAQGKVRHERCPWLPLEVDPGRHDDQQNRDDPKPDFAFTLFSHGKMLAED